MQAYVTRDKDSGKYVTATDGLGELNEAQLFPSDDVAQRYVNGGQDPSADEVVPVEVTVTGGAKKSTSNGKPKTKIKKKVKKLVKRKKRKR